MRENERQGTKKGGVRRCCGWWERDEREDVKLVVETEGRVGAPGQNRAAPRCVSSEDQLRWNNSHVKAQVLLLLKEVVQDVLSDKVWV